MIQRHQFFNGADRNHFFVSQHCHTVADGVQRVEVVRNKKRRETQLVLEFQEEFIERRRAARKEMLLATKAMVEYAIERLEKHEEK